MTRMKHSFWRAIAGILETLARAADQRRVTLRREILAKDRDDDIEGCF